MYSTSRSEVDIRFRELVAVDAFDDGNVVRRNSDDEILPLDS